MNRSIRLISYVSAVALLFLTTGCDRKSAHRHKEIVPDTETVYVGQIDEETATEQVEVDPAHRALLESYPDFIAGISDNELHFTDGTTMVYDDAREKDFVTRLDDSDPEDMFFVAYNSVVQPPEYLADAGRSRCESLFKKMYGSTESEVRRNLVRVPWFGSSVQFTSVNGAADSLKAVAAEISRYPELRKYVDSSGTFYWRPVRGAKRLSAHSYGIAIDVGVKHSDYWLWNNPNAGETTRISYSNKMPRQLVDIFERHGFIWGGAWYHYDTMHFEYRPEILAFARYQDS